MRLLNEAEEGQITNGFYLAFVTSERQKRVVVRVLSRRKQQQVAHFTEDWCQLMLGRTRNELGYMERKVGRGIFVYNTSLSWPIGQGHIVTQCEEERRRKKQAVCLTTAFCTSSSVHEQRMTYEWVHNRNGTQAICQGRGQAGAAGQLSLVSVA